MSNHPLKLSADAQALLSSPAISRRTARRLRLLGRLAALYRLWRRRAAERRELEHLDARTLRDIGISPGQIEYELRQPFWRPPTDWEQWRG